MICAVVVAACLWVTYPIDQMGFIDDWSYAKTALVFAQTGHFVYNGWATAMLGWQIVLGALFIKLFGFSFTVVRLSMLPVAMATIVLFHAVLVRFGVNARNAVLGTLVLGLSPIFIPLAVSYMTDVPGLFAIILCLYLCQRAVDAESNTAAIAWLCLAAGSNVMGGTVRQIAWLGALVMVPSTGWLLRNRRRVLLASLLLWAGSFTSALVCVRWFAHQPYSIPEPILQGVTFHRIAPWLFFFFNLLGSILCLCLLVFPILVSGLSRIRSLSRSAILRVVCIAAAWSLIEAKTKWVMPWLFHVVQDEFSAGRAGEMRTPFGMKLLAMPEWAQQAISLLVITTALIFFEQLRSWLLARRGNQQTDWRKILLVLGPFTASYLLLLMPRAYHVTIFDRYLLPLMPIAIICLLKLQQQLSSATLPAISAFTLAVFALLGIGGTHDWFAWYRARMAAIQEVRASGVPRTKIQDGWEYDGWTQIDTAGYVNEPRIRIPAGAYHPVSDSPRVPKECQLKFASNTPAVHPKFTVAFPDRMWCLASSEYPPVIYQTWLPPYNRAIYVQRIPDNPN